MDVEPDELEPEEEPAEEEPEEGSPSPAYQADPEPAGETREDRVKRLRRNRARKARAKAAGGEPAADRAPGRRRPAAPRKYTKKSYKRSIETAVETIGMGVGIFDPLPGAMLQHQAPKIAAAGNAVVQRNAAIVAFLERFSTTTAYGELVIALAPVAAAFLLAHGGDTASPFVWRMAEGLVTRAGFDLEPWLAEPAAGDGDGIPAPGGSILDDLGHADANPAAAPAR